MSPAALNAPIGGPPVVETPRLAVENGVKSGEKVAVGNLTALLNGESVL